MHNQEFEVRVREAMRLAVDRALKKRLPMEVAKDIAQDTVIAKAELLLSPGWVKVVEDYAMGLVVKFARQCNKENKAYEKVSEQVEDTMSENIRWKGKRGSNEASKSFVRDIAENGLLPREWQVVHGRYWSRKTLTAIAGDINISKQAVAEIHKKALFNLQQTLHKAGITKETWHAWYHETV